MSQSHRRACLSEYRLDQHMLGLESEAQREESRGHIEGCQRCQADVDQWLAAQARPVVLPAPAMAWWERLLQWVQGGPAWMALGAAAGLLAIVWFGAQPAVDPTSPHDAAPPALLRKMPTPKRLGIKGQLKPKLWIRQIRDGVSKEVPSGTRFRRGDKIQISFRWGAGAYVYLLYRDSQGEVSAILPEDKKARSVPLHQGGVQKLPDTFEITGPDRDESIIACFTLSPMSFEEVHADLSAPRNTKSCLWLLYFELRRTPKGKAPQGRTTKKP